SDARAGRRAYVSQRRVTEAQPRALAVDRRGLEELARDRFERAERDDHHEWKAEPRVRDDVRGERRRPLREPRVDVQAERVEDLAHDAVLAVVHAVPDQ